LLETNAHNKKLAETLLIFCKTLIEATAKSRDLAPVIDHLFLHYIVNTDGPIQESESSDPFDVFDAATRYAGLLSVGVSKDTDGNSILHVDDKEVLCPEWRMAPGFTAAWLLQYYLKPMWSRYINPIQSWF
jgi:hypothetical protein